MGIFSREPELSGILSGFSKTADQLSAYAARQREKVSKLKAEISDKEVELSTSEANIAQADASAAKLAEIIGSAAA